MAYAYVQKVLDSSGTGFSSAGTTIPSASWTNTAGNLIVVMASYRGTLTTVTMADTRGNTYTQLGTGTHDLNNSNTHWFYAWNCGAGTNVITATLGASVSFRGLFGEEYSGIQSASDPLVGFNLGPAQNNPGAGANAITSGNGTPTAQPALAWGAVANGGNTSAVSSAGTGYGNLITQAETSTGNLSFATEDKRITATTPVAATFTDTGGGSTYVTAVAFFLETPPPSIATTAWWKA